MDFTVPKDHQVVMKENEKDDKYLELAKKEWTEHHVKVELIPIVNETMDTLP